MTKPDTGARSSGADLTSERKPARTRLTGTERRAQILRHARDEFLEAGYSGARTSEIAARADVNAAMIYRHFDSKEALFEEAVLAPLREWSDLLPQLIEQIEHQQSPEGRRALRERTHHELLSAAIEIAPLLGTALFSNVDQGRATYQDSLAPFVDNSVKTIREGISGWSDRDPYVVLMATWGFALACALDRHFRGDGPDSEALAAEFSQFVSYGVRGRRRS